MAIQSGIALVPRSIIKYRIFWIISILEKVSGLIWEVPESISGYS